MILWHGLAIDSDRHIDHVADSAEFADFLRDENRSRDEIEYAIYGLVSPRVQPWLEARIGREVSSCEVIE